MRKVAMILVLAAACKSAPSGGVIPGSDSPRGAVDKFLSVAQAGDLQGLGAVWGDEEMLARERMPRQEFEQRAIIMTICLKTDSKRVGQPSTAPGGRVNFQVDLTRGSSSATTTFITAKNKSNRWFVQGFDVQSLQNKGLCQR